MSQRYRRLLSYLIPLMVALSTCVVLTHQAREIALSDEANVENFYSFAQGLTQYKSELQQEWRTRILSNFLAGRVVNLVEEIYGATDRQAAMQRVAALWSFVWLLMINLNFVVVDRERALLYIFGTFAAVSFAYTPGIGATRIYPWDLPSLFFFSSAVALLKLHREEGLVVLIPIAILFKETAILLVIAFLFWPDVSVRRRLAALLVTLLGAFILKGIVDLVTANPSPVMTMTLRDGTGVYRYVTNMKHLLAVRPWTSHPVFINAGLLASLFVLPPGDRPIAMLQLIALLFILGNFFFANIVEYRIWFEVIPLSLYAIDLYFGARP
jgi:hypothetical protein